MLTLFHDYVSPASAVAVARAHRLAAEGVALEIIGFESIGVDIAVPVTLDVLAELDAVGVAAAEEGVTLRRPQLLPPTGLAHVIERALPAEEATAWRTACYAALWRDGRDIADATVLRALAADAGADTDRVGELLEDRLALAAVRRDAAGRRRDGVGGVPTILAWRTLVPGLLRYDELRALAAL